MNSNALGNEVVIAIMGATGAGKSTFINLLAGTDFGVGAGLKSCTKGIEVSPPFISGGRRVTLVDTPGFDDTNLSDTEVLTMIALFLSQAYENGRLLSGVIFLHRISDFRVSGVTRRNFGLFRNLCGDENLNHVVIATNMWGQVSQEVGEAREMELASEDMFFKPALAGGAQMVRHDSSLQSAHDILQSLIDNPPTTLRIQRELVLEGKDITETAAGLELDQELVAAGKKHREHLARVQQDMTAAMMAKDVQSKRELEQVRSELLSHMRKNEEERTNLSSQYAREKEEMDAQLASLKASLEAESNARQQGERALADARRSQENTAAEYRANREMLNRQIADLQRQHQNSRQRNGLMNILIPAVTFLAKFL
ncbi:hypothetical protein EIP91_004987 [Steccherinum ochraceum]|uniref:G domain-containing protein n=1 Tax=Steccherinum ochraceum TaxID=92696 RepID=A0A4R0RAE2_9APHY|nr:hypothetical protein EIP91_004987 [Steccherinum ochraceum]